MQAVDAGRAPRPFSAGPSQRPRAQRRRAGLKRPSPVLKGVALKADHAPRARADPTKLSQIYPRNARTKVTHIPDHASNAWLNETHAHAASGCHYRQRRVRSMPATHTATPARSGRMTRKVCEFTRHSAATLKPAAEPAPRLSMPSSKSLASASSMHHHS